MILETMAVRRFRNFLDSRVIPIESDVTALVWKNESGKSTLLHALFRLNPANAGYKQEFDVTEEYPRWRLTTDRRKEDLLSFAPIEATFLLEARDRDALEESLGVATPEGAKCVARKTYGNALTLTVSVDLDPVVDLLCRAQRLANEDAERLRGHANLEATILAARILATKLEPAGHTARAASVWSLAARLNKGAGTYSGAASEELTRALQPLLPQFFYFSNYSVLAGRIDLDDLLAKEPSALREPDATALALLNFAGVGGAELQDSQFESRKAELEAAALDLTNQVFEYWNQNTDLSVVLDDERLEVGRDVSGQSVMHQFPRYPPPRRPARGSFNEFRDAIRGLSVVLLAPRGVQRLRAAVRPPRGCAAGRARHESAR